MSLYTPGPVKFTSVEGGRLLVTSSPLPIHSVVIERQAAGYRLRLVTLPYETPEAWADTLASAKEKAARWVNRAALGSYGRFSGPQRWAMGQQKCPYAMYGKLCNQAAGVGTVWCVFHPNGREVKVD